MDDLSRQPGPSTELDLPRPNVYPCFMPDGKCVDQIVKWIGDAKELIIIQAYSFSSKRIAEALKNAQTKEEVTVKIMIDKDCENKRNSLIPELRNHGIEIEVDQQAGKAHNKVMIIDNDHVITGSYNWTDEQYNYDSDVIIFIKDTCVNKKYKDNYETLKYSPQTYTKEIDPSSLLYSMLFGCNCKVPITNSSTYTDDVRYTKVTSKSEKKKQKSEHFVEIDVCFPRYNNQDCIELISKYINDAKELIFIQACSFTHEKISDELIGAHKNGIEIKLLVDRKAFNDKGEKVRTLINSGIEVKCDAISHPGIAHSKIIIIDDFLVLAGSFNLTRSAQNFNRENLLHMKNIHINKMFKENFYRKWDASESMDMQPDRSPYYTNLLNTFNFFLRRLHEFMLIIRNLLC